ncbi:MAG: hypothetical protein EOM87_08855 [Clostridia bacterium]|nr:hypothetical protein [Clostridia bacterium]
MAKYECRLRGDFDRLLSSVENGIISGSVSASLEDQSTYTDNGVKCAVRVFERYSILGGNRVSLNITLIGNNDSLFLSAITSGGSRAMFFKLNTLGEESFLDKLIDIVENFKNTSSGN